MKITLNADKNHVNKIRKMLKANNGYCPCVLIKDETTKCMCKEFVEEIEEGPCHCGLYIKTRD